MTRMLKILWENNEFARHRIRSKTSAWSAVVLVVAFGCGPSETHDAHLASEPGPTIEGRNHAITGVATERAMVNFTQLVAAEFEPGMRTTQAEGGPDFFRVPGGLSIPDEAARRAAAPAPSAPPLGAVGGPWSPAPSASFQGLDDNLNNIPPDTHGAVSANHLMVTLNSEVGVQDRSGTILSRVSLEDFWASLSNPNAFDPKVLYDPYQDRWMTTACADSKSADSSLLIGVSQTSDPTGSWNLYRVDGDPADLVWIDFPSMGFNVNWIVVQVNMYEMAGSFSRSHIYVFDKADLYAGGTGNYTLISRDNIGATQVPASTLDPTEATMYLATNWNGDINGTGYLNLFTITGAVGSEVLTQVGYPSTPNPWDHHPPNGEDFAPQLGSTRKIQVNDARLHTLTFRNDSLWASHTVFLPAGGAPTRSAIQWWEFSTTGTTVQVGRIDDPSGTEFYGFPSLAVNECEDVLVGYASFSATQYASGSYAFRRFSEPPGTLQTPELLKAGEAPYEKADTKGRNRWGDYSNTVVDPVNDRDFWTIQEYADTPSGSEDRWATWWGHVVTSNATPQASNLSLTPSAPFTTQALVAGYDFSDADGDPDTGPVVRWYQDATLQPSLNDMTTVLATNTSKGQQWYFTLQPSDSCDIGTLHTSSTVTVVNSAPMASSVGVAPGAPLTADDLVVAYTYMDADTDAESGTQIRWYLDGALQPTFNDVTTVAAGNTSKGQQWYATVQPGDGTELGILQTASTVTVQNTAPVASNLLLTPSAPRTTEDLVAAYGYDDADSDGESGSQIRWYKNGVLEVAFNDMTTVSASNTSKGEQWYFTVQPSDGSDLGTEQTSNTVTVQNTAPTVTSLSLTPESPYTTDDLAAGYTYSDADTDVQSGTQIRWFKNDVAQPALDDLAAVTANDTTKGEQWYFTVQVSDAEVLGTIQTSETVTVLNTVPTVSDLRLTPDPPVSSEALEVEYTYADADDDSEGNTQIRWYVDGEFKTALDDQKTVPGSETSAGQQWYFTVRPNDGTEYGTLQQSNTVTIGAGPVTPESEPATSGGCGCRLASRQAPVGVGFFYLFVLSGLILSYRRRARRSSE